MRNRDLSLSAQEVKVSQATKDRLRDAQVAIAAETEDRMTRKRNAIAFAAIAVIAAGAAWYFFAKRRG